MIFDMAQRVFSQVNDGCNHEMAAAAKLLQSFIQVGRARGPIAAKWSQLAVTMGADMIPKVLALPDGGGPKWLMVSV
jgi:hypothetical protein